MFIFSVHFHGQRKTLPWKEYNQGQTWLIADFNNVWDGGLAFFFYSQRMNLMQSWAALWLAGQCVVGRTVRGSGGSSACPPAEQRSEGLALPRPCTCCWWLSFTLDLLSNVSSNQGFKPKTEEITVSLTQSFAGADALQGCERHDLSLLFLPQWLWAPVPAGTLSEPSPEDIRALLWGHEAMSGAGTMSHEGRKSEGNILGDSTRDTEAAALLLHLLQIFFLGISS